MDLLSDFFETAAKLSFITMLGYFFIKYGLKLRYVIPIIPLIVFLFCLYVQYFVKNQSLTMFVKDASTGNYLLTDAFQNTIIATSAMSLVAITLVSLVVVSMRKGWWD